MLVFIVKIRNLVTMFQPQKKYRLGIIFLYISHIKTNTTIVSSYYSLAECKYRSGDKAGAAQLLNAVRKRNYPDGSSSSYAARVSSMLLQKVLT